MKVHYFGTAAAEGVPAIFCHCDVCTYVREHGGRELRSRAQAMIDGKIMLDFGPDTYYHSMRDGVDLSDLRYCLITHAHEDHLLKDEFALRKKGFALLKEDTPMLEIFGGKGVKDALSPDEDGYVVPERVVFREVKPYEKFNVEDYSIVALPAFHGTVMPLVFVVSHEGKTFLYAHDTDIFTDDVWDYLAKEKPHFDAVSLDCTEGIKHINYRGHMNFERDFEMRDRLNALGLTDEKTLFIANHFSHNGKATYAEASKPERNGGFIVTYDGMDIEF